MRPATMRLVPHVPEDETFTVVDWKTGPADVLEEVSELLAPHGLCIVLADSQDDSYRFKVEHADDREVGRILAMSDEEVIAEIETEGRDPAALAEAMRGQMNATFRLVEEARSWRTVAERLGGELRDATARAVNAMESVTVFVTSKERIYRPAGEQWWQEEIAAIRDMGALIPNLMTPDAIKAQAYFPSDLNGRDLLGWISGFYGPQLPDGVALKLIELVYAWSDESDSQYAAGWSAALAKHCIGDAADPCDCKIGDCKRLTRGCFEMAAPR